MHETNAVYGTITPKAQTERKSTEIVEKKNVTSAAENYGNNIRMIN